MTDETSWLSKPRVETFSDGVFAIVVTLLVLEIKVPVIVNHSSIPELYKALLSLTPKLISWIISFMMVCVIWVNHHRLFESINFISNTLFWLNSLLLLCCSFIPFPTALVGDYIHNPVSLCFFGLVMTALSFFFILIRIYFLKTPELLKESINKTTFKKATRTSIVFGPVFYVIGSTVAWINTEVAILIFLFLPLYFIFFNIRSSKKSKPASLS